MNSIYDINIWSPGNYDLNDIVYFNGSFYYCVRANSSTSFDPVNDFNGTLKINTVELPFFLWRPSYSSKTKLTPKVKSFSFGDGYEQRITDLIFNDRTEFNVVFEGRDDKEARAIAHFLRSRKGGRPFFWKPDSPFGDYSPFICTEWDLTRDFANNNIVTAKFTRKTMADFTIITPPPQDNTSQIREELMNLNFVMHWRLSEGPDNFRPVLPVATPPNYDHALYDLHFFKMNRAVVDGLFMQLSSDFPANLSASSLCPNITAPYKWYQHPWGGMALTTPIAGNDGSALLNAGNLDFTFTGWVKFNAGILQNTTETVMPRGIITIANNPLYTINGDPTYYEGFELKGLTTYSSGFTTMEWAIWSEDGNRRTVSIASLTSNVWYFFVCGYNKNNNTMFLSLNNGALQTTACPSPPKPSSLPSFVLMYSRNNLAFLSPPGGTPLDAAAPLQGKMTALSRWNRILTSAEITYLYNSGKGRQYPYNTVINN